MMRWIRRLFWLGAVVGAGFTAYRAMTARQSAVEAPLLPPSAAAPLPTPSSEPERAANMKRWLAPANGRCPDGYPIKANGSSGIFHVPGGRFYDRTTAERCYANADDAITDGYRPAKA